MTEKQKMYIAGVLPAIVEQCYHEPAGDATSPDELAASLGAVVPGEELQDVLLLLSGPISATLMVMGVPNHAPLMLSLLKIVFTVAYDLGRLGALDEMSG